MELINQGLILMVVGMSSVFLLLAVLVATLNASAKFFEKWPLDAHPDSTADNVAQQNDLELVAIALAAAKRSRG